jgi:iron complex outermembrane receptor protein
MTKKLSTIALAAPLLLASSLSYGQNDDDLFDDLFDEPAEKITITGIRSRLKANLDQKRYSDSVVDGISAEDIGKFPDKNIADSLQRVTGVSITRDFGEGEKISIRGTAPGLNRTLLNGQNVATADWFVLDNPTRSFNYSLLASEMVSALEVYKSPEADIDEGSIGGTVILRTRRPLSIESGKTVASVQMAYSDKSEEWDPQLSGLYSWHDEEERFGALISLVSQKRTVRRDGFEVLGYSDQEINGSTYAVPDLIGSAYFQQDRERNGGMVTLQFQPSDELLFTFNALYSKLDADNLNHNMLAVPTWEFDEGRNPDGANITDMTVEDGTVLAMEYGAEDRPGAVLNVANRVSYSETSSYDLDIMYDQGDYQLHFQGGYTEAEGGTTKDVFSEFSANSRQSFDLTSGVPEVGFQDIDVANAAEFNLDWAQEDSKPQEDDETYAQVDFTYFLDGDFFTAIKTGVKLRDHSKTQTKYATRFHNPLNADDGGILGDMKDDGTSLDDYTSGNTPSDFMDNTAKSGSLTDYPLLDTGPFEEVLYSETDSSRMFSQEVLPDFFDINEEITALYVKVNFEGEEYKGNFGVRYVETDVTSESWRYNDSWVSPTDLVKNTTSNKYDDILPSFNISYNLNEEMLVRFAAAQVMARPEYIDITDSRTLNNDTLKGEGGNPDLDPFRANQFDVSYEWYFADTGLFSAAVFYKDIESYIVNSFVDEIHYNDKLDQNSTFSISKPINGDGGTNQGLEIGYQLDLWAGWGMQTNYTYSDAEADDGSLIPGNSEHTYNATVYYENDTFNARVSYNHRSEYFEGLDRGSKLMTDGFGQMDGSFTYDFTENMSFVLQALNVTDEDIYKYSETKSRPYAHYSNGRRFFLGMNLNF